MSLLDYITGKPQRSRTRSRGKVGVRFGEIGEIDARKVITFEVTELDNTHILRDAAKKLRTTPTRKAVFAAIRRRFGRQAQALWLCREKDLAACRKWYGSPGQAPDRIKIPKGAIILSDLGADGQLYLFRKQELHYV